MVDIFEHRENVVHDIVEALDSSSDSHNDQNSSQNYLRQCIRKFKLVLGIRQRSVPDTVLPLTNNCPSAQTENFTQPDSDLPPPEPERYICVCFPSMTYKKYLYHVDVNKARTDPDLFVALQEKYFDWKPLWKRIFTLRNLARVEYFEVSDVYHYMRMKYLTDSILVQNLLQQPCLHPRRLARPLSPRPCSGRMVISPIHSRYDSLPN